MVKKIEKDATLNGDICLKTLAGVLQLETYQDLSAPVEEKKELKLSFQGR